MSHQRNAPQRLELPEITGRGAHLLIWIYYVTISALALLALDDVHFPAIVFVSIGIFGAIWFALTRDTRQRGGRRVAIFVISASVVTTLLSAWNSTSGGFSQWYVGVGALVMFYLSLRGRDLEAWIGFSAIGASIGLHLQRIADGAALTSSDRQELLVAEARLRDGLRARQLDLPEIAAAVQRARRRGTTVLLLDDRYPLTLPAGALARIISEGVCMLDSAVDGRVTIRLLPAGRSLIATMVADGEGYTRVEVPALLD